MFDNKVIKENTFKNVEEDGRDVADTYYLLPRDPDVHDRVCKGGCGRRGSAG